MKALTLPLLSLLAAAPSLLFGASSFFNAAEDPSLAGTGWNATSGSNPDPTPTTNGDPASWGGTGGIANAGATTGDDWMAVGSSYVFDGVDDRFNDVTLDSFNSLWGFQPTTDDFSVDIYFSPDSLSEVGVLWETGGAGAGAGIAQDGSNIVFSVAQNAGNQSDVTLDLNDLSTAAGDWYQLRLTIDPSNQIIASITDGSGGIISGSDAFTGTDWAGGNNTGLGDFDGNIGGDVNRTISDLLAAAGGNPGAAGNGTLFDNAADRGAWSFWAGQIGKVEYRGGDMAFLTLVPEPSRALLLAMGCLALFFRRTR